MGRHGWEILNFVLEALYCAPTLAALKSRRSCTRFQEHLCQNVGPCFMPASTLNPQHVLVIWYCIVYLDLQSAQNNGHYLKRKGVWDLHGPPKYAKQWTIHPAFWCIFHSLGTLELQLILRSLQEGGSQGYPALNYPPEYGFQSLYLETPTHAVLFC